MYVINLCKRISLIIYLNKRAHMGMRDIFDILTTKIKMRFVSIPIKTNKIDSA